MDERPVDEILDELADDETAVRNRLEACRAVTTALAYVGKLFWVTGSIVGPDRVSGASPFNFGDDSAVGIATVMQIGGELGQGCMQLLEAGNRYSASALVRQLVEVEYLAHAFAVQSERASDWLRADRQARLKFWSPRELRAKSGGIFLASDYSQHCERGGHPTTKDFRCCPGTPNSRSTTSGSTSSAISRVSGRTRSFRVSACSADRYRVSGRFQMLRARSMHGERPTTCMRH